MRQRGGGGSEVMTPRRRGKRFAGGWKRAAVEGGEGGGMEGCSRCEAEGITSQGEGLYGDDPAAIQGRGGEGGRACEETRRRKEAHTRRDEAPVTHQSPLSHWDSPATARPPRYRPAPNLHLHPISAPISMNSLQSPGPCPCHLSHASHQALPSLPAPLSPPFLQPKFLRR